MHINLYSSRKIDMSPNLLIWCDSLDELTNEYYDGSMVSMRSQMKESTHRHIFFFKKENLLLPKPKP